MASVKIFNFNNYHNRRVILSEDFGTPVYLETGDAVNFNPGDGVTTTFTAGRAMNAYNGKGDYFVYFADNITPTSRWFILDANRTREGQYSLTLKRDVAVDYYEQIISADTFIEKAILPDNNPLIFNKENISVNQIKKAEYLLRDVTQTAWIIGYLDRKYPATSLKIQSMDVVADINLGDKDISTWELYDYVEGFGGDKKLYGKSEANNFYFEVQEDTYSGATTQYRTWINFTKGSASYEANPYLDVPKDYITRLDNSFDNWVSANKTNINSIVTRYRDLYFNVDSLPALYQHALKLNGQVIKDKYTYYKITINQKNNEEFRSKITIDKSGNYLLTWLKNEFKQAPHKGEGSPTFMLQAFYQNLTIKLEEIGATTDTYTVDIPDPDKRLHLKDAPYDMFCIPYMSGTVNDDYNSVQTDQTKTQVLNVVQSMAQQIGTANLYDLQLVPYSPMTGFEGYYDSGKDRVELHFKGTDPNRTTYIKTAGGKDVIPMFWSAASSGSLSIKLRGIPEEIISKKMASECYMARLVSPNYNGQFEFNPAKLDFNPTNLTPTLFNVDYTFIPYNPFIRVSPVFGGLYGSPFTDARGLICGGDFSIAYLSDVWVNYQILHKNTTTSFCREVAHLETQYKYQNLMSGVGIATGALSGAVSGGMIGSMGGLAGASIGAVVGAGLSAIGGAGDYSIAKKLQAENLDYKNDMFGYQLDNIKALPNSIAKTTAYNSINKIFPSLEIYECTPEEKKAVANKIAWNSMSVGIIDKVENYLGNTFTYGGITDKGYIKGKLIRIDIEDDNHIVEDITDELNRGWYFK